MKPAHVLIGLTFLAVFAAAQSPQTTEMLQTVGEASRQARNLRSYHASAIFTDGSAPIVVVLDPNVQAPNGLVITDAVVHPVGGASWSYMVEIRENGITKASLGEALSPTFDAIAGSPTLGLRSGIPIQTGASLEIGVWGGTYSPTGHTVLCTISGYVW